MPKVNDQILKPEFFARPTLKVAPELLGKFLVRQIGGEQFAARITEVEAYDGFDDQASHASRGKTPRNAPMFGPAGFWYIYIVYGMHWMLNVVTREAGYPAAILIRGVQDAVGPGRLTRQFKIDKKLNNQPALLESGLWFEERDSHQSKIVIKTSPRIGVDYAGRWAKKPWRFFYE